MQLCAAIIKIKQIQLAVVQVEPEHTWPSTGPAALLRAQRFFPTLPILLLSPRVSGFSRSYSTFDIAPLIHLINADEITWQAYLRQPPSELPF
ncbi:hypothetical protein [Janthinobacterium lividum]|uniref:hypothetical protein n=1 Tax=Janthinobacterium lividum TaxID=29581 RepID=UPI001594E97F|nr:hypothetical protein [Janthinobacterium lividum]QKY08738.1 hypothetical protein G8765_13885 [Janthinobacterium lividum]